MGETNSNGFWFDAFDSYFENEMQEYWSNFELFWNIPNVNKTHLFLHV